MTIIKLAVSVSFVSIFYKIYLQSKLNNKSRKGVPDIFFRRYYSFTSLFPISKLSYNNSDHRLIKKANKALLIFYVAFTLLLILSAIEFSIKSKG